MNIEFYSIKLSRRNFQRTTGFSTGWTKVFDDDVPDAAPADDADAFPIDDVSD